MTERVIIVIDSHPVNASEMGFDARLHMIPEQSCFSERTAFDSVLFQHLPILTLFQRIARVWVFDLISSRAGGAMVLFHEIHILHVHIHRKCYGTGITFLRSNDTSPTCSEYAQRRAEHHQHQAASQSAPRHVCSQMLHALTIASPGHSVICAHHHGSGACVPVDVLMLCKWTHGMC